MGDWSIDRSAAPTWWPVEQLHRILVERYGDTPFQVSDFMYMGRSHDGRSAWIHLYKHRATREYLCVDESGYLRQPKCDIGGRSTWVVLRDPTAFLESFGSFAPGATCSASTRT